MGQAKIRKEKGTYPTAYNQSNKSAQKKNGKVQVIRWPIPKVEWDDVVKTYGEIATEADSKLHYLTGVAISAMLDDIDAVIINDTGSEEEVRMLSAFIANEFRIQHIAQSEKIDSAICSCRIYSKELELTEEESLKYRSVDAPITIITVVQITLDAIINNPPQFVFDAYKRWFRYLMSKNGLPEMAVYEPDERSELWWLTAESCYDNAIGYTILDGEKNGWPSWAVIVGLAIYAEKSGEIKKMNMMEKGRLAVAIGGSDYSQELNSVAPGFLEKRGISVTVTDFGVATSISAGSPWR